MASVDGGSPDGDGSGFEISKETTLWVVTCRSCGDRKHAVGAREAAEAVATDHRCGPGPWHMDHEPSEAKRR